MELRNRPVHQNSEKEQAACDLWRRWRGVTFVHGKIVSWGGDLAEECADMTTKSIATALALSLLAFTLSVLPVTPAQAACGWKKGCQPNETNHGGFPPWVICCTGGWSNEAGPCPPGWNPQPNGGCLERPVKNIGKSKATGESSSTGETPAALKPIRDCRAKGWRWDQSAGKCIKPSEAKANCESKGPNYSYDLDTGGCVKQQASDDDDDDYKPTRKKKQKRHYDEDYD